LYASLETYRRILKPNGRLIIAVPNYTSYDAAFIKSIGQLMMCPSSFSFFAGKHCHFVGAKGFALKAVEPMWFDSFYVSMLSEKYRNGKGNFLRAVVVGVISNLKAIFNVRNCSSVVYEISIK
jgi:hypothetical protein